MGYWKPDENHSSLQFIIPRRNKMQGLGQKDNEISKENYADIYLTSKRNLFTVTVITNEWFNEMGKVIFEFYPTL